MAVAAADVASVDLRGDDRDAESVADQLHDAVSLSLAWSMIEIQNPEIHDTAVDAGVRGEVRGDEGDAGGPLSIRSRSDDGEVTLAIASVVLPRRRSVARAAHLLQAVRARSLAIEVASRLGLAARPAPAERLAFARYARLIHPVTVAMSTDNGVSHTVGPVGIEPTTRGLTCHFGFRRHPRGCSWSGLSLHHGSRRRCHPSSLYTFRILIRLGSGLPSVPRKGSPTLSGVIPGVSPEALLLR